MKIAVIGATGKTGSEIVQAVLRSGNVAIAVSYDENTVADAPHLIKRRGNILDQENLTMALAGADAVIISVGAANQFKKTTLISTGTRNVIGSK